MMHLCCPAGREGLVGPAYCDGSILGRDRYFAKERWMRRFQTRIGTDSALEQMRFEPLVRLRPNAERC